MARKMKDSGIEWIGEIPEGWEVVQLKRFAEVHNGREIDVEVDSTDSSAVGVYGSGGVFKYTNRAQYSGKAVLFGRKGTLGKPLYVEGQLWAVDTMYFLTYSNRLLEKFSYYQFLAFNWAPYITHTAIPSVVASEIVACYFPIPPLEEQAKIADYLDNGCASLDTILDKTRSSIEEYKKLKQAVITQAVTKGVRGKREMKDSGVEWIGEIPAEWSICPLKRLAAIQTGSTPSKTSSESFYSSIAGTPWIKPDNLGFSSSIETTAEFLTEEGCSVARILPSNTVYVGCIGSRIGNCGYSLIPCACNQQINALIFNARMYWKYGWYLTIFQEEQYMLLANGNVIQIINSTTQGNISCIVPSISEQREITAYLDAKCAEIDGLIAKKEQLVKELESYKKSLIYEVVTGKREV